MEEEYIIINKTAIQKRIEELESRIQDTRFKEIDHYKGQITSLKRVLSQSTPLIPEIKKAFDAGHNLSGRANFRKGTKEYDSYVNKQDYISNLKLDI